MEYYVKGYWDTWRDAVGNWIASNPLIEVEHVQVSDITNAREVYNAIIAGGHYIEDDDEFTSLSFEVGGDIVYISEKATGRPVWTVYPYRRG